MSTLVEIEGTEIVPYCTYWRAQRKPGTLLYCEPQRCIYIATYIAILQCILHDIALTLLNTGLHPKLDDAPSFLFHFDPKFLMFCINDTNIITKSSSITSIHDNLTSDKYREGCVTFRNKSKKQRTKFHIHMFMGGFT